MSSGFSRRGLFSLLGRPLRGTTNATKTVVETALDINQAKQSKPEATAAIRDAPDQVAIIQGRFCLAYTSFCTVCAERCPVPGAMTVTNGIPMVVNTTCTGCGICHDVCPAPTNAVLVLPRRRPPRPAQAAPPNP